MVSLEHIQLPLSVVTTPAATMGVMTTEALTRLPSILLEEEEEAYSQTKE